MARNSLELIKIRVNILSHVIIKYESLGELAPKHLRDEFDFLIYLEKIILKEMINNG